jgi:hypothetical protein
MNVNQSEVLSSIVLANGCNQGIGRVPGWILDTGALRKPVGFTIPEIVKKNILVGFTEAVLAGAAVCNPVSIR